MTYNNTAVENLSLLHNWISSIKLDIGLITDFSIQPIVGDASLRKYYLLSTKIINNSNNSTQQQFIIMQTPIDNSMKNFINIANFLSKLNLSINIPKIFAIKSTPPIGYLLLSYLGEKLLFKNLNFNNAESMYKVAWQAIANIQLAAKDINLPAMDRRYIKKNLILFKTWYLKTHLNLPNLFNINNLLNHLENYFVKIFSEQPQVFVHIDYHSKNLILETQSTETNNSTSIGILDFQDAMLGPITYDIASLLQDAYLVWPEDLTEKILFDYHAHVIKHNKQCNLSQKQFLKYFYLTGLQRHIKNLGIFARLKYFYRKPDYLKHIPNLLNYINKTCDKFPEPEILMLKNFLLNATCGIAEG